jgi:hypothetical protein
VINVGAVAAGEQVNLSNLPVDGSATPVWQGRRIYRSIDGGAFSHVGDIANVTVAAYNDNTVATGAPLDDSVLDQANYSYYVTFYHTGTQLESRPRFRIAPDRTAQLVPERGKGRVG